jgi:hypothetical protein
LRHRTNIDGITYNIERVKPIRLYICTSLPAFSFTVIDVLGKPQGKLLLLCPDGPESLPKIAVLGKVVQDGSLSLDDSLRDWEKGVYSTYTPRNQP